MAPWSRPGPAPRCRFHPDCKNAIRTISALPISPTNTEDVDTEAEDHPYDGWTYGLQCRVPQVERDESGRVPDDRHPGFDIKEGRAVRKPRWSDEEANPEEARRLALAGGRFLTGVRVGNARPYQED
jgi:hypothetical protein